MTVITQTSIVHGKVKTSINRNRLRASLESGADMGKTTLDKTRML